MGFASEIKSQILKSAAQGSRILAAGKDRNPKSDKAHLDMYEKEKEAHLDIFVWVGERVR